MSLFIITLILLFPRATSLLQSILKGIGCRREERGMDSAVGIYIFFDLSEILPDHRYIEEQTENITK